MIERKKQSVGYVLSSNSSYEEKKQKRFPPQWNNFPTRKTKVVTNDKMTVLKGTV